MKVITQKLNEDLSSIWQQLYEAIALKMTQRGLQM